MPPLILIVDDALLSRLNMRDILYKAGWRLIIEAESGLEAVENYKRWKPDLVIMDILMPGMDGIDAAKKILEDDPGAKIIMCSALGQQMIIKEALEYGVKDFIVKPPNPDKVLETVRKVLG